MIRYTFLSMRTTLPSFWFTYSSSPTSSFLNFYFNRGFIPYLYCLGTHFMRIVAGREANYCNAVFLALLFEQSCQRRKCPIERVGNWKPYLGKLSQMQDVRWGGGIFVEEANFLSSKINEIVYSCIILTIFIENTKAQKMRQIYEWRKESNIKDAVITQRLDVKVVLN